MERASHRLDVRHDRLETQMTHYSPRMNVSRQNCRREGAHPHPTLEAALAAFLLILAGCAGVGAIKVMATPLGTVAAVSLLAGGIGVLFNYFPARRAARMGPIEASRHE